MSSAPQVLVTGATGRLGRLLVPRLLARGAKVRAFTRQAGLAIELREQGAAPALGDFGDAAALRGALHGVSHLFLLSPITPELAAHQTAAIEAAAEAGVQRIVKLSGSHWTIEPPGRSLSGDAHGAIEAALRRSSIAHQVLRPNAWLQVMLARLADELAAGDVLQVPPGDPQVAYIDARDIADVAVEALLTDAPGTGAEAPQPWVLTGARAIGYAEIARIASRLTGRAISTAPRPPTQAVPSYIAQVHAQFAALIGAGEAAPVTDTVQRVLGRPPRTVEAFVEEAVATRFHIRTSS